MYIYTYLRGWRGTVGSLDRDRSAQTNKKTWASVYWGLRGKAEGYGFIESEISNSTVSRVLHQPLAEAWQPGCMAGRHPGKQAARSGTQSTTPTAFRTGI